MPDENRKAEDAPTTVSVAVVVCAYTENRWDELLVGVTELVRQTSPDDAVIVVIDHNDALLRRTQTAMVGSRTVVVANREARGLSGARNSGVAACECDVVLFLDDDAFPDPGWIDAYRRRFVTSPDVVAVGGAVEPKWEGGMRPRWFPVEFGWVVGCDYRGMSPSGSAIRNPIGASMGIRRRALDAAGPFRSQVGRVGDLPVGCEETELSVRLRRAVPGSEIVRDEAPVVHHFVPRERQRPRYFVRRCYHEGRSKAVVSRLVGRQEGLSSERSYVVKTLVRGVGLHLADALRGDLWGVARAGMLPVGLCTTVAGFATEQVRGFVRRRGKWGGA